MTEDHTAEQLQGAGSMAVMLREDGRQHVRQDVAREDIKIEMGRDAELAGSGKNRLNQPGRIKDGIAGFGVAEQIDQGNVIGLRPRERSHDKVEISRREARPTIRLDHRELIMSIRDAAWQALSVALHKISRLFASIFFPYAHRP